jgi:hypothetical protein
MSNPKRKNTMTDEQIKDWENCVQVAKVRSPNAWVAVDAGTVLAVESALRAAVPDDVIDSLNFVDDFIARCNGDDRGSCESVNIIRRWLEAPPQAPQAAQPVQPSDFSIRPDGKGGTGIFYEPVAQPVQPSEQRDAHFGGSSYEASMLRNLLARIHGDGGQYLAQHGLDKALEAADQLCAVWRAQQAGAALKPLSDAEIAEIILQEQFLLVVDDEESFTEIVRAIERAHHIREN